MRSLVILFLLSVYSTSFAQISPGELTEAHAEFEGMSNCTQCHVLGEKPTDDKCLACHTEIQKLLNAKHGYHTNVEVASMNCSQCHNEHHGRKFAIIRFNEDGFDHNKTGYELVGKHKDVNCSQCHKSTFINELKLKKKDKTFLGLSTECVSCHEDIHQNTLRDECQSCHTTNGFKPADKFDHSKTKFILTGKHITAKCEQCHKFEQKDGKQFQHFSEVKFSTCEACHTDTHKGKFGSKCESCHTTDSFRRIKNIDNFNHDKTNYPLQGKHKTVLCLECHKGGLQVKPAYKQCVYCHIDYHEGQLTKAKPKDCSECHTVKGFTPSYYTIETHNLTDFNLLGSHLAIPCQFCHKKETKWNFRFENLHCVSCHENVHGQSISSKYFGNSECSNCHNEEKWSSVTFDHNTTEFILLGKHISVACSDCHYKTTFSGKTIQLFKDIEQECEICHEDIHRHQFIVEGRTNCANCHAFDNWKAVNFDHNKAVFNLEGAHSKVECSKCHKALEDEKGQFIQYKFEDTKCINCHS